MPTLRVARAVLDAPRPSATRTTQSVEAIAFQPYRNRDLFRGEGQAHHLNQSPILGGTVPYGDGITTPLRGDAFRDVRSEHFLTHRGTESFFDIYRPARSPRARYPRPDGWLVGERPTFSQFNRAFYNALQAAGVPPDRALRIVQGAIAEQLRAGFRGADLLPDIPLRIGQSGGP